MNVGAAAPVRDRCGELDEAHRRGRAQKRADRQRWLRGPVKRGVIGVVRQRVRPDCISSRRNAGAIQVHGPDAARLGFCGPGRGGAAQALAVLHFQADIGGEVDARPNRRVRRLARRVGEGDGRAGDIAKRGPGQLVGALPLVVLGGVRRGPIIGVRERPVSLVGVVGLRTLTDIVVEGAGAGIVRRRRVGLCGRIGKAVGPRRADGPIQRVQAADVGCGFHLMRRTDVDGRGIGICCDRGRAGDDGRRQGHMNGGRGFDIGIGRVIGRVGVCATQGEPPERLGGRNRQVSREARQVIAGIEPVASRLETGRRGRVNGDTHAIQGVQDAVAVADIHFGVRGRAAVRVDRDRARGIYFGIDVRVYKDVW